MIFFAALVFLLMSLLLLLPWLQWWRVRLLVGLTAIRVIFDVCRPLWLRGNRPRPFSLEITGLVVHGALICVVGIIGYSGTVLWVTPEWIQWFKQPAVVKGVVLLAALCVVTEGGAVLVRAFFEEYVKGLKAGVSENEQLRVGRLVGMLERLLIAVLTIGGHFGAIGFVLAAKSIARFKELEKRAFAEYYLLGTLLSCLIALAVGWLVGLVWSIL